MTLEPVTRRTFLASLAIPVVVAESGAVAGPSNQPMTESSKTGPVQVLCTEELTPDEVKQLRSVDSRINLKLASTPAEINAHIAHTEIVLGEIEGSYIPKAPKLKWIQAWEAGVDKLPAEIMTHPSTLTNMQRTFAPVIAETTIGLLLCLTRGITQEFVPAKEKHQWVKEPQQVELDDLYEKTVGIVGMGGIGSEIARRLKYGFQMKVLGTDAKPMPRPDFVDELHDPSWLMEMVPQVDVLISAAPLTKETKEMFNAKVFNAMKKSSYFINVSRGGLVDQPVLIKTLKQGKIRGAGLDVVTPEPLPADSELWDLPNVVITGHTSGQAPIRKKRLIALVSENLRRYCVGLPLMNVVDKEKGY